MHLSSAFSKNLLVHEEEVESSNSLFQNGITLTTLGAQALKY